MLKTGLTHGAAVIPDGPKERYFCPKTGAHFKFNDMCFRLEAMERKRAAKYGLKNEQPVITQEAVFKAKEKFISELKEDSTDFPVDETTDNGNLKTGNEGDVLN